MISGREKTEWRKKKREREIEELTKFFGRIIKAVKNTLGVLHLLRERVYLKLKRAAVIILYAVYNISSTKFYDLNST